LGYIVWSYTRARDETHYMSFVIQSGAFTADDVNQRADTFIKSTPDILASLDDETFKQLIDSSIEQLEKNSMSISEQARKFKNLIFEHDADFERDIKTIAALQKITKSDVVELFSNTINEDSRKMINCLMFAKQHENTSGEKSSFSDLKTWKSSRIYN